ncbi:MAG: hypothetical protein K2X87_01405 [Gemmataceae bacterium]|nr:hypothetical protein [Gemmataceae bacterium]
MDPITVDAELAAKLAGLKQAAEVQDADGRSVGQFVPRDQYLKLLYAWARTLDTSADLAEARKHTTGRRLDAILREGKKG